MEFKGIKKIHTGKFITRYDVLYETVDGKEKVYEMISRDDAIDSLSRLSKSGADAVVMVLHDETGEKILLNCEYRMAVGKWVYNFPAGLMEQGENVLESAKRELKEETGLDLIRIDDYLGESYSAVGFSNEKNVCVVGVAAGTLADSDSTLEEIKADWYTKEQVRQLLNEAVFAARTQSYCYLWSRED